MSAIHRQGGKKQPARIVSSRTIIRRLVRTGNAGGSPSARKL
jgi:hypothetical protein